MMYSHNPSGSFLCWGWGGVAQAPLLTGVIIASPRAILMGWGGGGSGGQRLVWYGFGGRHREQALHSPVSHSSRLSSILWGCLRVCMGGFAFYTDHVYRIPEVQP